MKPAPARMHPPSAPRPAQPATTTLLVRNMVCDRCIRVVRDELQRLGLDVRSITLGEVVVSGTMDSRLTGEVKGVLERNGFELIEDKRTKTIERIKLAVLKLVREERQKNDRALKTSTFVARELGQEYQGVSELFSTMEGITIEQYLILQRIELVKELLKYGELTLSEISYRVGYSSVQHLSNQFKKITGLTPSQFKQLVKNTRNPLDRVSSSSRTSPLSR